MSSNLPLHNAITQGNLQLAKKLLQREAFVLITDSNKNTPLHVLVDHFVDCLENEEEVLSIIDLLLKSGVDINAKNKNGSTALHIACWRFCDTVEIIEKLLNWGADINLKNKNKETAFEIAFRSKPSPKWKDFLKLYHHIQKLKDLNAKVDDKNNKLCKMILNKKEEWKDETDWLVIEKMFSDEELFRRHQERLHEIDELKKVTLKDKVSLFDYLKMDVKEAAVYANHEAIEKIINADECKSPYENYGYLILVAHYKSLQWMEIEESTRKEKNAEITSAQSALETCTLEDKTTSTVNKNSMNQQSDSVEANLHDVIKLGNGELAKKLLDEGASVLATDADNNSPLHLAFSLKRMKMVDLILNQVKLTSNYANLKNNNGLSHLHIASARGDAQTVEKFINAGANVREQVDKNSPQYSGFSALQFSCHFKNLETLQVLSRVLKLFASASDEKFKFSIPGMCGTFIKISHMTNENRLSDFHFACFCEPAKVVKKLLQRKAINVNSPMSSDAKYTPLYTALHFVVESSINDRQEKVKLLLKHGADVNLKNSMGMTPLHLATYSDTSKMKHVYLVSKKPEDKSLEWLYEAAKDKETNPMDAFGLTYLHIAVAVNDLTTVRKMLFRGERVNQAVLVNRRGLSKYTALHFAAKYGRAEIAKLLIERGADVEGKIDDPTFDTPLQVAIDHGERAMIDVLLQHGANVKVVRPKEQETTIHLLAKRFNEMHITCRTTSQETSRDEKAELVWYIEKLASLGVDVDAKTSSGDTALHIVCKSLEGHYRFVEWLLNSGADVNVKNGENDTPLDLVARDTIKGNYDDYIKLYHHVQRLKDLGLKVDPRNEVFCDMVLRKKKIWMHNSDWAPVKEMFSSETLIRKKRERHDEIQELQRDMLDGNMSLYDYLKMTPEAASMFATNDRIKQIVDNNQSRVLYPIYGYLITVQHRKSLKWLEGNKREIANKTGKKMRRGKRKPT